MPCIRAKIGLVDGVPVNAIICVPKARPHKCCGCKRLKAFRQCDWKTKAPATCDAWICEACTTEPTAGKDLCPTHAKAWEAHKSRRLAHAQG